MQFGILGSGSWATALAKILTDHGQHINWWIRNSSTISHLQKRKHNPHYLSSAYFNTNLLSLYDDLNSFIADSDCIIIAVPSAYVETTLENLPPGCLENKKIVSAVKGILPGCNTLLNLYLADKFNLSIQNYFTVLGPCHAEEVASEKLSYLTFSGINHSDTNQIAESFQTDYINVIVNPDVIGVQYAAVLKNIYALGAGVAHGLEYGDNFLSVYITNAADEMVGFLKKVVKDHDMDAVNYASSVYLGDLLVTCYSLYSRNRMFGNMLGKGYSVKAAQLELNMVAEGYNASRCINIANQSINANIPIAKIMYDILWEHLPPDEGFRKIEKLLI